MKELRKIMTIFGTRPEAIKLAPVLHELERRTHAFQTVNVSSGQHRHLSHAGACQAAAAGRDLHRGTFLPGREDDLGRIVSTGLNRRNRT